MVTVVHTHLSYFCCIVYDFQSHSFYTLNMTDNIDDSYLNSGEFNSSQSDIELDERQLTCSVCSNHYGNRDKGVSDSIRCPSAMQTATRIY